MSRHGHERTMDPVERLAILHLAVFVFAASWAFGGQAPWVRPPLTAWGCLGGLITLSAVLRSGIRHQTALTWILPIALFNGLVILASFNSSLREIKSGGDTFLAAVGAIPWLPSSARPELARTALLEYDAIWLSCFNLVLVVRHRRALRRLLLLLVANGVALAVFGTIQKLSGAKGIYFGSVPTPQVYFFASFVYHNHWGAFALLVSAASLALARQYSRRASERDALHSPLFLAVVVVVIIMVTIPLSGSRSSTILAAILLGCAMADVTARSIRKRRHFNESALPPVILAILALALAGATSWWIGRDMILRRITITAEQFAAARTAHAIDPRLQLYRDTFAMAADRPWFGWGMASFPYVFTIYNSRAPIPHFPVFYHDAHSDWLQALAEHGYIGSAMLVAAALLPLWSVRRCCFTSSLPAYMLAGCLLIVVYALVEFPFGNFAVVLTWWACFFSAVQYARLSGSPTPSLP